MQLQIKAQHASVSDSVHAYTEKRLSKLSKRLYEGTRGRGDVLTRAQSVDSRRPRCGGGRVHEGPEPGRARVRDDLRGGGRQVLDKLERQIERHRDKRVHEPRRAAQRKRDADTPGEEAAA